MKYVRLPPLALAYLGMAACAFEVPPVPSQEQRGAREVFSDADRRVARALSISNRADLVDRSSPYSHAIACELAVQALAERMDEMNVLTKAQEDALSQAQRGYSRQVRDISARDGKDEADIERDKAEQREAISDPAQRMQIAIGCLRDVAGTAPTG